MEDTPKPSRFIQQDSTQSNDEEDNQKADNKALVCLTEHGNRCRLSKMTSQDIIIVPKIPQILHRQKSNDANGYEDDGIYCPETLERWLPQTVVDHLEERLKRESLSAAFSSAKSSIDPFATESVRPLLVWRPPQVLTTHWADADKISAVYSELLVRIPKLHLTDHSLFTLEDSLSLQLRFLHHEYSLKYAALSSLNHRYSRLMEFSPLASLHDLYPEVNGFACVLTELHDAFDEVYSKWNELKELRRKDNVMLTPLLLSLRQVDASEVRTCITSFIQALQSRVSKDDQIVKCIKTLETILESSCLYYCIRLSSDISTLAQPSHEETIRRQRIRSIGVYCELVVNDNVVMTTKKQMLTWPNFTVEFNEQITLHVVAKPSTISLRIYERSKPMTPHIPKSFYRTLCQAFQSEICAAGAAPTDEWYQFCHDAVIPRKEWSPSYLNSSYYSNAKRHIKGAIHVHLSWKTIQQDDGRLAMQKIPIKLRRSKNAYNESNRLIGHRPKQELKTNDGTHFTHEKDFFTALASLPTLDPNAVDDQPAMRLQIYHEAKTKRLQELELFRLHPMSSFDLSPHHGPSTLKRHKLLQLRDKVLHDQAIFVVPIPLSEHSIAQQPAYLELIRPEVQAFNRGLASDKMNALSKDGMEYTKHQLELRRQDFMERVRNNHNHYRRPNAASPYSQLSTIVQEYPKPMLFKGWSPDFSGLSQLFARKRSLRPAKKATPPLSGLIVDRPDECRIYVQIQRMTNAHIRRSAQENQAPPSKKPQDDESNSDAESNDDEASSSTFGNQIVVQVSFQGNTRKTSCSSGVHPTWMETVILPFKPPLNDWSTDALMRIRDTIQFNIMDQVIVEDDVTHTKDIQLRFLGGVSVPFTTLYYNHGEIIAQLRCDVPIAHLGYVRKSTKSKKDEAMPSESATYLSVMIKLDPALVTPSPKKDQVVLDNEPLSLLQYAEKWVSSLPTMTLHDLFVPTVVGSHAFVTQYLQPQAPPPNLTTIAAVARFVSLIPFLEDWHTYPGAIDVWATTQDFLELQVGDWEEHAILLCNYFNYLDQTHKTIAKSYLLLGSAVPEGPAVYVLRQTLNESILWNACTGVSYNVTDTKCPLYAVLYVAAKDNVWANLSKKPPCALSWPTIESDVKSWKPFFTPHTTKESLHANLPPLQQATPIYHDTPPSFLHDVEVELLESIKMHVRKWRSSHSTTVFNSDVSFQLKEALRSFESHCVLGNTAGDMEAAKLLSKYPRFSFHGSPFCFPFTDIPSAVVALENTRIHEMRVSGVEYALAVHVHGYSNLVVAVWIYYCALLPRAGD